MAKSIHERRKNNILKVRHKGFILENYSIVNFMCDILSFIKGFHIK